MEFLCTIYVERMPPLTAVMLKKDSMGDFSSICLDFVRHVIFETRLLLDLFLVSASQFFGRNVSVSECFDEFDQTLRSKSVGYGNVQCPLL